MQILRYDELIQVSTSLDQLEALTTWICGLRSKGYTSDILQSKHKITDLSEIRNSARLISTYAENSIGLIEQAYSGPPEVSFLPLYYCILNLSKIYIVLSGRRLTLLDKKHRYHGATHVRKNSRDLLNEKIEIKPYGVLPLFYEVLTQIEWGDNKWNVELGDVYPFIHNITHEYEFSYKRQSALQFIKIELLGSQDDGYYLKLFLGELRTNANNMRYLKVVRNFHSDPETPNQFISNRVVKGRTQHEALNLLLKDVRKYLISAVKAVEVGISLPLEIISCTPVSSKRLLLPDEVPIWLAFFHLSNVVRYNPEFLFNLKDSKAWSMLLALRKEGFFQFLISFWSYLHQSNFLLTTR